MMMNTDSQLHFKDMLQDQWTTAQAAGRMETVQASQAVGSGGVGGTARAWGMGFYGISSAIYAFSLYGMFIGAGLVGLVYALKASQGAMAASVFAAVFFFVFALLFHAPMGRMGIQSGVNILISVVAAAITAAVVGFFIYEGDNKDEPKQEVKYMPPPGASQKDEWPPRNNELPAYNW